MKTITLWVEGYSCTGEYGTARHAGSYDVESMDDAVELAIRSRKLDRETTSKGNGGVWREWGCRIFDNEKDARESFG